VIGVHAFCFAGPVVDVPGSLVGWDTAWDCERGFRFEGCYDCYESTLGFARFSVFPIPKELNACWGGRCIHYDLSSQVFQVLLFMLFLGLGSSSFEGRYWVDEKADSGLAFTGGSACASRYCRNLWEQGLYIGLDA